MRIVIAPDSYKECLTAPQVAQALAQGAARACPDAQLVLVPMADGGQGTVDALVAATKGTVQESAVTGPLGEQVRARWGRLGDGKTAVIEMAAAAGLAQVPLDRRDPRITTTRGVGELMIAAFDGGADHLIVAIGGSATNDGGAGMAQSLGYRLVNAAGRDIGPGGGGLAALARIEPPGETTLKGVIIDVACDVTNPFIGPTGASAVFGPQKGATPAMVAELDANLARFAEIIRRDLGAEIRDIPGAGAAGGLGGGLVAFANGRLRRGIELVSEAVALREKLEGADLCLTGEGMVDATSAFGKTAVGVATIAKRLGIPTIAIGGAIGKGASQVNDAGVTAYFDVTRRPLPREQAFEEAPHALAEVAEQVVRLFLASRKCKDHSFDGQQQ